MNPLSSPYLQEVEPRGLLEKLMILMRFVVVALSLALFAYILKLLLGYVTPQIHDNVFLHLKGNVWNKYFPFSLFCLSVFTLLATYNIFAFIYGKSLVRWAYIRLIRRFLYIPEFGNMVMRLAWLSSLLKLKPKLLENIVTTDCALCLDGLTRNLEDQANCRRLVSISRILPKITELTQPDVSRQLKNVEMLLRSLILFELRTSDSLSNPHAKRIAVSGLKLIESLSRVGNTIDEAKPEVRFCSFRFADLLAQVAVIFNQAAQPESAADDLENSSDPKALAEIIEKLMPSHYQREKSFVDIGLNAEECFFIEEIEPMPEVVDQIGGLVDEDVQTVRASGILPHGIALYLSAASGCEGIISSYKNSIEALRFCTELIDEGDSPLGQCKSRLSHLSASLDEPWFQGLLAEMKKHRIAVRSSDWSDSVFQESDILDHEDFEYADQQADTENMHAGPDFSVVSPPSSSRQFS